MPEPKPEEGEPIAGEKEVTRKEHQVSIVLSFMDDEHEKAAIEVRRCAALDRTGLRLWDGAAPPRNSTHSIWNPGYRKETSSRNTRAHPSRVLRKTLSKNF
jgi:hypothetical protein